jgi:regulator of sirC expression with transglutaminase-like and TPR domain
MDDNELKALVSLLDDPDKEVIAHVEQKIISLGNDIIPYLETEWENNFNPDVQKRIEDLIHALQYEVLKNKLAIWRESGAEDLLEGVWLLATYQYPDLEYSKIKKELEQIYYEAWLEFKPEVHPFDQIKILNSVIFSKLKFGANTKNFHAPGNSMINVVLESKKGNPISLCVIYMLVAQKLKLPVYGVNLPNLFICTYKAKEVQFYINAFNRGLIFSRADIDNYISHLHIKPLEIFYEPCGNVDIIKRMLRNLVISFEKLGEPHKVDEIKQLLEVVSNGEDTPF